MPKQQFDELDRRLINQYQGNFPLTQAPFSLLATTFGVAEEEIIKRIEHLLSAGWLSRFGPLYNAERLGGGLTLAALAVPEADYAAVTEKLNQMPAVAHNYRRDHTLNMWFVLATDSPQGITCAIDEIESTTGLKVSNFPKLREFYLGLWFEVGEENTLKTRSITPRPLPSELTPLDENDRRLVIATQEGLPLLPRPYAEVGRRCGLTEDEVMERLQCLLSSGAIRRIGLVPNHYRLGFRGNGMSVWDIDQHKLDELGPRIAALDFVSHCYERPRHLPVWPYNLFAMLHGKDRDEVRKKTAIIAELLGGDCHGHDILFSTEVLKKTGLRLAA